MSDGNPEYIEVEVSTLDAEAEQLSPALVKVDVDGAELEVIEGASALLRARPLLIFEHVASAAELYEAPSGAVWRALDELGYEVFPVTGEGRSHATRSPPARARSTGRPARRA